MAIDPKELRIGSHVNIKDVRVRVVDISQDVLYFSGISKLDNNPKTLGSFPTDENVNPIPITPELLTELGFEYRDNTYWERWFLGGFDIERKEDSKYFDYSSEIRLEYLHELESLYYMIYGQELIND